MFNGDSPIIIQENVSWILIKGEVERTRIGFPQCFWDQGLGLTRIDPWNSWSTVRLWGAAQSSVRLQNIQKVHISNQYTIIYYFTYLIDFK